MTCGELGEQLAGLVQPTPYEERPVNVAYESDPWRTIRAQGYMCYTHSCQFEAQILTRGVGNDLLRPLSLRRGVPASLGGRTRFHGGLTIFQARATHVEENW